MAKIKEMTEKLAEKMNNDLALVEEKIVAETAKIKEMMGVADDSKKKSKELDENKEQKYSYATNPVHHADGIINVLRAWPSEKGTKSKKQLEDFVKEKEAKNDSVKFKIKFYSSEDEAKKDNGKVDEARFKKVIAKKND
jgi:hypothetical protein